MFRIVFAIFITLLVIRAHGAVTLGDEFAATYYSHYQSGRCGQNTADLIRRAQAKGVDLAGARVAVISNSGYLFSTMYRRDAGRTPIKGALSAEAQGLRFEPGIRNFYFHVLLEMNGDVYDFDFGNKPEVISLREYFRRMFWVEPANTEFTGLDNLDGRRSYKIAFVPVEHFLAEMSADGFPQRKLSEVDASLVLASEVSGELLLCAKVL